MGRPIVYGTAGSTYVWSVRLALAEKGVAHGIADRRGGDQRGIAASAALCFGDLAADGRAALSDRRPRHPRRSDGDPAVLFFRPGAGGRGAAIGIPEHPALDAADGEAAELSGDKAAAGLIAVQCASSSFRRLISAR